MEEIKGVQIKDSRLYASGRATEPSVSESGEIAKQRSRSILGERTSALAQTLEGVADALRKTAQSLLEENDPSTARYFSWMAKKVSQLSLDLRERDFNEVWDQSRSFARRHPAVVFGGAVALGLSFSRFLKSSSERREEEEAEEVKEPVVSTLVAETQVVTTPAAEPMSPVFR